MATHIGKKTIKRLSFWDWRSWLGKTDVNEKPTSFDTLIEHVRESDIRPLGIFDVVGDPEQLLQQFIRFNKKPL